MVRSKTIRIKGDIFREKLVDDPNQLSGAMSKGSVMTTALSTLQVIVFSEGFIVLYNVVS